MTCDLWICFLHGWRSSLMEFKEASSCLIIHKRIRICHCDTCCKGGDLDCMFLGDILHPLTKPMVLYCDNQSAIAVTKNDQYHARTKHIDIQYHFIWESISREIIKICYCPTENMVADIFTKALPVKTFEHLRMLLGVHLD